uniref:Potassium channel domain-containing protein n=1 Tax=Chromera velia CCMP2878 TaxID=1169474 RepID=A0A0G4H9P8_9ALVE|eukprot:Cvel_25439.t1-p1 / transcript=Cvel_25439.t1 / gene=Cvel_25439 / organism=Chromera_velia_CCMP2878 / gene_product=Two pore potassium channel c, putative / transcript_product=Two pore potassium channel c, putative / location=Cvel_scaffold2882:3073-3909(-) / protein_length=279 / sequence_SO=supercontig / SO=protein_coding / is_pseudo=false
METGDSHRRWLVAFLIVAGYLSLGVVMYAGLLEEWSVTEALYFSVIVLTTVGFGDLTPSSSSSKLFTCVFILVGVGVAASCLTTFLEAASERAERMGGAAGKGKRGIFLKAVCLPLVLHLGVGMMVGQLEGWGLIDSVYSAVVSVTTVGFGDLTPRTDVGRMLSALHLPVAVVAVANALEKLTEVIQLPFPLHPEDLKNEGGQGEKEEKEKKPASPPRRQYSIGAVKQRRLQVQQREQAEYILEVLLREGKVTQQHLQTILKQRPLNRQEPLQRSEKQE